MYTWLTDWWTSKFLIEIAFFYHLQLRYDMTYSFKINPTRIEINYTWLKNQPKPKIKLNLSLQTHKKWRETLVAFVFRVSHHTMIRYQKWRRQEIWQRSWGPNDQSFVTQRNNSILEPWSKISQYHFSFLLRSIHRNHIEGKVKLKLYMPQSLSNKLNKQIFNFSAQLWEFAQLNWSMATRYPIHHTSKQRSRTWTQR